VTLVEFIDPARQRSQSDLALAVLFFFKHDEQRASATSAEVRVGLERARVRGANKINISRSLERAGSKVDRDGRNWLLTQSGDTYVAEFMGLPLTTPTVQNDIDELTVLAASIEDEAVRDYILESIKCLQIGAYRAAIVFLWTGAVARLRDDLWNTKSRKEIEAALKLHRQNAKFGKKADFAYVKDSELLQVTLDLSVLDKTQKQILEQSLELRNGCGHPTKYNPGEKKTSSYIEDVVGIAFK
jgi:hypothetical protein